VKTSISTLTLAVLLFTASSAHAQRAGGYIEQQAPAPRATSGIPGMFNTEVVDKGHVVGDLPFLAVDVGITENFSAGAYGIMSLPLLAGQLSGMGRLRYRFFSNARVSALVEAAGGTTGFSDEMEGSMRANIGWLASNVSWHLGDHTLTGSLRLFRMGVDVKDDPDLGDVSSRISALMPAVSYQWNFKTNLSWTTTAFAIPWLNGSLDAIEASVDATDNLSNVTSRFGVMSVLSWRSSERWLFEGGGMYLDFGKGRPLPWISVARRW
jgi:hypothetical protein